MHSPVDSCLCPDWGLSPQLRHIGTMLSLTELPGQGLFDSFFSNFCILELSDLQKKCEDSTEVRYSLALSLSYE